MAHATAQAPECGHVTQPFCELYNSTYSFLYNYEGGAIASLRFNHVAAVCSQPATSRCWSDTVARSQYGCPVASTNCAKAWFLQCWQQALKATDLRLQMPTTGARCQSLAMTSSSSQASPWCWRACSRGATQRPWCCLRVRGCSSSSNRILFCDGTVYCKESTPQQRRLQPARLVVCHSVRHAQACGPPAARGARPLDLARSAAYTRRRLLPVRPLQVTCGHCVVRARACRSRAARCSRGATRRTRAACARLAAARPAAQRRRRRRARRRPVHGLHVPGQWQAGALRQLGRLVAGHPAVRAVLLQGCLHHQAGAEKGPRSSGRSARVTCRAGIQSTVSL
jgi:hypothetical protein